VKRLAIPTVMLLMVTAPPALASESMTLLPNGTPINVTVDLPVDGTEYVLPPGGVDLDVQGTASVGFGAGDATVAYVLDVSGSVNSPANTDCGGDLNSDGVANTILDCEIAGVLALNAAAASSGSVDEVGLAVYGRFGAASDMTPAAGSDPVTVPSAGPGDVETVATSVVALSSHAGPTEFTSANVNRGNTNFAAGLDAASTIVGASTNGTNLVVFLSDGQSNSGGDAFAANLDALAATGSIVHAFAVGAGSNCGAGSHGTLQQIADATYGTCTEVADPADLAGLLSGLLASSLDRLDLTVDGGEPIVIPNTNISRALPQDGPVTVAHSAPVSGLGLGAHAMCVTAFGHDAGGVADSGPACTTVYVYGIDLTPATATKELGTDTTHTVTATIAGESGSVGGRTVTLAVTDGPNVGTTGTGVTDIYGSVRWKYANTGAGGIDTIRACFTVAHPTGQTGCATATVKWADTTPPLAACLPGPNPHGDTIPPAGWSSLPGSRGGQNEDGFYDLAAWDAVDPSPLVHVVDDATGHVFGPYAAGTKIKWTQAPGRGPRERSMGSVRGRAGAVAWHLTGQGDMRVYATDASGNSSSPLICLVPPLPK
jgi:hypothetical protein